MANSNLWEVLELLIYVQTAAIWPIKISSTAAFYAVMTLLRDASKLLVRLDFTATIKLHFRASDAHQF
eukprot:COSAG03_NODE_4328_length_1591_cov_1.194370_1_plen_68_part_00